MLADRRATSSNQHPQPPATQTSHIPPIQPSDHGYAMAQSPPTKRSQGTTQQSQQSQGLPLPLCHELPTLEEVHTEYIPTITWCPKAAREDFAQEMADLYNRVANNRQSGSSSLCFKGASYRPCSEEQERHQIPDKGCEGETCQLEERRVQ